MNTIPDIVKFMEILGGRKSGLRNMGLRHIGLDWIPDTQQECKALAWLSAAEHRQELKDWYSQMSDLNPYAQNFRHYLERRIGEPLPLKGRK